MRAVNVNYPFFSSCIFKLRVIAMMYFTVIIFVVVYLSKGDCFKAPRSHDQPPSSRSPVINHQLLHTIGNILPKTPGKPVLASEPITTISIPSHTTNITTSRRKRSPVVEVIRLQPVAVWSRGFSQKTWEESGSANLCRTTSTALTTTDVFIGATPLNAVIFQLLTSEPALSDLMFIDTTAVFEFFSEYPDATTVPSSYTPSSSLSDFQSQQRSIESRTKTSVQCATSTVMESVCVHDCTFTHFTVNYQVPYVVAAVYRPCGPCSIRVRGGRCVWSRFGC